MKKWKKLCELANHPFPYSSSVYVKPNLISKIPQNMLLCTDQLGNRGLQNLGTKSLLHYLLPLHRISLLLLISNGQVLERNE